MGTVPVRVAVVNSFVPMENEGARLRSYLLAKTALARALHVRRYELVAAMDGDLALAETDERTREVLRQEIEAVLDERLGPRREARGRSGAA
jgi:hypothetical protein